MYKLLRYEKDLDGDKIVNVFVSVRTITGFVKEYFLTPEEVAEVVKKESNLTGILEDVCAQSEKDQEQVSSVVSLRKIEEPEIKKTSFVISEQKVSDKKALLPTPSILSININ